MDKDRQPGKGGNAGGIESTPDPEPTFQSMGWINRRGELTAKGMREFVEPIEDQLLENEKELERMGYFKRPSREEMDTVIR